jgi:hypothetical protein
MHVQYASRALVHDYNTIIILYLIEQVSNTESGMENSKNPYEEFSKPLWRIFQNPGGVSKTSMENLLTWTKNNAME